MGQRLIPIDPHYPWLFLALLYLCPMSILHTIIIAYPILCLPVLANQKPPWDVIHILTGIWVFKMAARILLDWLTSHEAPGLMGHNVYMSYSTPPNGITNNIMPLRMVLWNYQIKKNKYKTIWYKIIKKVFYIYQAGTGINNNLNFLLLFMSFQSGTIA